MKLRFDGYGKLLIRLANREPRLRYDPKIIVTTGPVRVIEIRISD